MTTKFFVYPYTQNSAGAIMLAEELDGKRVKRQNSTYSHKPDHVLINWGAGDCPYPQALNAKIMDVINKKAFFSRLNGTGLVPPFALSKTSANANLSYPVVCRTTVEGHDGQGIVIAEKESELVPAGLYVQYVDKTSEYRVHVGRLPNGTTTIIHSQKKFKTDAFTGDQRIWTGNETKFALADYLPNRVDFVVRAAFDKFTELAFGAFDVIYDNSSGEAYVLEINSAPMLHAAVAESYAKFFRNFATATQETPTMNTDPTPAPQPTGALPTGFSAFDLIKAQLVQGHVTKQQLESYMPPITEEALITNYVNKLTA